MHRVAVIVGLLVLAQPAAAQITQHGEPGIQPIGPTAGEDRLFVSGQALVQVLLEGNTSNVEEVAFSYAPGPPPPTFLEARPALRDLANDSTPADGWFLPVNASELPTGSHSFAIHTYSEAGDPSTETARLFGPLEVGSRDALGAWPIVLPGETARTESDRGPSLTIETIEQAKARLRVNGELVELDDWTPPARDDDPVPRESLERNRLGSAFQAGVNLTDGDVLRVVTNDSAGNQAGKALLVGHGVDQPVLEVSIPVAGNLTVRPGDKFQGIAALQNVGMRGTMYDARIVKPDAWNATISPSNLSLPAKSAQRLSFSIEVAETARADDRVAIAVDYQATDGPVTSTFELPVRVNASSTPGTEENGFDVPVEVPSSPGLAALGLLGAALLARRRRLPPPV